MNKCVQCKQNSDELIKHSVYKGTRRYICRPCKRERMKAYRSHNVATDVATIPNAVATQIDTVDESDDYVIASVKDEEIEYYI